MPGQPKKIALFHWILVFFSVFVGFFVAQPTLFCHPSANFLLLLTIQFLLSILAFHEMQCPIAEEVTTDAPQESRLGSNLPRASQSSALRASQARTQWWRFSHLCRPSLCPGWLEVGLHHRRSHHLVLGNFRALLSLLRHLAARREHSHHDRHVPHRFPDSEHAKSRRPRHPSQARRNHSRPQRRAQ